MENLVRCDYCGDTISSADAEYVTGPVVINGEMIETFEDSVTLCSNCSNLLPGKNE